MREADLTSMGEVAADLAELRELVTALADVLSEAEEFFTARDEMNAKVHLAEPRWSPITLRCRAGIEAWRRWNFPGYSDAHIDGEVAP